MWVGLLCDICEWVYFVIYVSGLTFKWLFCFSHKMVLVGAKLMVLVANSFTYIGYVGVRDGKQ